jgi:radical SAM protein with 4Fe4S-binding SPASM domain
MLKFHVDPQGDRFVIRFDVPAVSEVMQHDGFSALTGYFARRADCRLEYDERHALIGIAGDMVSLLAVVDETLGPNAAAAQRKIIEQVSRSGHPDAGSGLQVNFHQNPFDTPLRYWRFILNQGYFIDYFYNRINWYIAPKMGYVTDFPLHVDLESASTCNMNCPMCYRHQLKDTGQMEMALFRTTIDECAASGVFSVRLSWRGETLTHPRIKEMIAYATKRIKNVSFLTNAFYLEDEIIDCLIDNRLSYVAVSFDGIEKVYETIRHPALFTDSYHRLERLKDRKQAAGTLLPQVRLCTIWPAVKADPDRYARTMCEVSDYMVCNPYINFAGPMRIKEEFICQYPWERIVVGYNGDAQCCTGWNADDIILGNVKERSISSMWHSDLMNRIRAVHSRGERMTLNSCAACRHGSESDADVDIQQIIERRY